MTVRAKNWLKSKLTREQGAADQAIFTTNPGVVNSQFLARVQKHSQRLAAYCSNQRLNLKTSPPYLQGILYDVQEHLGVIFTKNLLDDLRTSPYLNLFGQKYIQHLKKTIRLFKDAREMMEDEHSEYRRLLNKETLVFSHIYTELKTVFEGGQLKANFEITKRDARSFWETYFGDRVVVAWREFLPALASVHPLDVEKESKTLKQTMDLTENDHISWFEFDIFTRLFQPWATLLNNWNVLALVHPGYKAFMTYDEVQEQLKAYTHQPGSYMYRLSCTRLGQWAIGFVTKRHQVVQTIPRGKPLFQALAQGAKEGVYLYPNGEACDIDLEGLITATPAERIQVTKEQYDIYYDMDTTFELCKICDARVKDIKIEPCGHLMCKKCLSKWESEQEAAEPTCPFCRKPVVSTEAVVVEPFKPSKHVSRTVSTPTASHSDMAPPPRGMPRPRHHSQPDSAIANRAARSRLDTHTQVVIQADRRPRLDSQSRREQERERLAQLATEQQRQLVAEEEEKRQRGRLASMGQAQKGNQSTLSSSSSSRPPTKQSNASDELADRASINQNSSSRSRDHQSQRVGKGEGAPQSSTTTAESGDTVPVDFSNETYDDALIGTTFNFTKIDTDPLPPLPPTPTSPTDPSSPAPVQLSPMPAVGKGFVPDSVKLSHLISMGFDEEKAKKALKVSRNDFDMATDILLQFS